MFYAAKCYWPGVSEQDLERAVLRTAPGDAASSEGDTVIPLGFMFFPNDALVLCLFEAASRAAVMAETVRAGLPCDRVMELVWLTPRRSAIELTARKEKR
jgi:hypothetical protein